MLKIDFFLTQWASLACLEKFFISSKNSYFLELLETIITLKCSDEDIKMYNPLIIKAPTASGKTHLLEAVARKIHERRPDFKLAFGKALGLVSIFNDKRGQARRIHELQNCHVLLLDDLQALAPYPSVQDDLASLLDALIEKNVLIVLNYSDSALVEKKNMHFQTHELEDSLVSRIYSGLSFNLERADLDLRMRIVEEYTKELDIAFTKSMCLNVARYSQDVRQLKGLVKTLSAFSKAKKNNLTEDDLDRFLQNFESKSAITAEIILIQTSQFFNVKIEDLKGKKRAKDILLARQVGMYLCRKLLALSYLSIAELFGGRDHTTVMHSCKKIEKQEDLRLTLNMLSQRISHSVSL